jgi:hypothetical protein
VQSCALSDKLKSNEKGLKVRKFFVDLLMHCLSSMSEWGLQDMAFNLQDFYYNILFLFEDEKEDDWASETLAYWNIYVTCII